MARKTSGRRGAAIIAVIAAIAALAAPAAASAKSYDLGDAPGIIASWADE